MTHHNPMFRRPGREELKAFTARLVVSSLQLLLFGGLLACIWVDWSSFPAITAARDAITNANMRQQAVDGALPASAPAITLVAMDHDSCETSTGVANGCAPSSVIDREALAGLIRTAASSQAKVLAIDVAPVYHPQCDQASTHLIDAIAAATRKMIVVLPRDIVGQAPYREGQAFLDQCPVSGANVDTTRLFFGHPLLSPTEDGMTGAITPWITESMAGRSLAHNQDETFAG